MIFDIEIFDALDHERARYLVHVNADVLWTDSIDDALQFLRQALVALEPK